MTTPSPQEPAPEQPTPEPFSQPPAPHQAPAPQQPPAAQPPYQQGPYEQQQPPYQQAPYQQGPYQQPYPQPSYQQPQAAPVWQPPMPTWPGQPTSGVPGQPTSGWPAQYPQGAYPPGAYPPGQPPVAGQPAPPGGYPPGWSPVQQPPKKKRTGLIIGVIAGVLLLFCGVAGGFGWWVYERTQEQAAKAAVLDDAEYEFGNRYDEHRVILTASGSGPVTLTLFNGSSEQSVDTSLPWRQTLVVTEDEFTVWVKITPRGDQGNPQRCTIDIDGSPVVQRGTKDNALTCAVVFSS